MADDVPDHLELASEPIAEGAALMVWHLTLADGSKAIELGNWSRPPDFDPDEPALIGPSSPLRFTVGSLPTVLALARTAEALAPKDGLPAAMPKGRCGMLAHDGPLQALACRGPDGTDVLVLSWHDASAAAHVPLAKAGALARVLAAAQESLGPPGSSRLH